MCENILNNINNNIKSQEIICDIDVSLIDVSIVNEMDENGDAHEDNDAVNDNGCFEGEKSLFNAWKLKESTINYLRNLCVTFDVLEKMDLSDFEALFKNENMFAEKVIFKFNWLRYRENRVRSFIILGAYSGQNDTPYRHFSHTCLRDDSIRI